MSVIDTITYFGRLKGMQASDARKSGLALLERFELGANVKSSVDKLSKGMAQKVQLATALVNRPRLLILDEPFSGLDPVNQGLLEEEIRRASANGATVIFSTHVMQHAERLCDRLLLLARGRKKFEGTLDQARAELPARLTVIAKQDPSTLDGVESAEDKGEAEPGWRRWSVLLEPGVAAGDVLERCVAEAIPTAAFRTGPGQPARRVRPYRRNSGDGPMKNILIVAAREFRQITSMRSFWLTLLIIPFSIGIGAVVPQLIAKDEPDRVMVIDRTGGSEARAIAQRFELDRNRNVLSDLSRYVQRHHLEQADPGALWAQHDRWYSDEDVARFMASGGLASAQAKIERVKAKDTPKFEAAKADYQMVPGAAFDRGGARCGPRSGVEAGAQARGQGRRRRSIM